MGPGGDFGDHAAEGAVCVILADDSLGKDLPVTADQGSGAIIAGGLKGENEGHLRQAFA